jgi:hypothetical protein
MISNVNLVFVRTTFAEVAMLEILVLNMISAPGTTIAAKFYQRVLLGQCASQLRPLKKTAPKIMNVKIT